MKIDLTINTDLATQILTGFIHSEITRTGRTRAVIALSGGVDLTLSCYLAARALGPENILAVRMPYKTSSADSLEHAQLVIDALGVQSLTVPIAPMVDPLIECFPEMDSMRRGNIMARLRMVVIYDQSVAFNGLVVGTGNKTEILLGYTTLYGDSACALILWATCIKPRYASWRGRWVCRNRLSRSRPQPICGLGRPMRVSWVSPTRKQISSFTC